MGTKNKNKDEEVYRLAPSYLLECVLDDYGINHEHMTLKMMKHMYEDFMHVLEKHGYAEWVGDKKMMAA